MISFFFFCLGVVCGYYLRKQIRTVLDALNKDRSDD